ncbi:AbrB/MazE/SpoVT family DNA-binding domain-containing protein [Sandaracinobacteroides saxicola]|uniref:AbrB/MazE/SpoVT family DNA-binding domain-containing protein n=1 Tax=Sandaracinobacteroides saxicola TaxID=2759707 RepID=A0A7G5IEW7_9SPHN|nr:AbrB/MazE/SpoVT family DNA-binding domain-containing protein [Sandaracinobacteroides saxicola]QMW21909.1 AbrB/MazE/SpoVT family DNA-binding domain-containing protein [Sandaracinobacteroides saxicola]
MPMSSALRRTGNSVSLIVPRPLLAELGAGSGTRLDLSIVDGALVARPIAQPHRSGWSAAAAEVATDGSSDEWLDVPLEGDEALTW